MIDQGPLKQMRLPLLVLTMSGLAACASDGRPTASPAVADTVDPISLVAANGQPSETYHIGPTDKLAMSVFQVPDLSFEEIYVDAAGRLQLPLLGSIQAAGLTPAELSSDIERRLAGQYLRNPQVTITVSEAASQKVTVDGAVTKPGVYVMRGHTTLLQAVAMAEGPTPIADLESVAVFRTLNGRRMVAVFDLRAIRTGQATDPVMLGDDVVVVDTSRLSKTLRDVVQALPGLAVFGYL